MEVAARALATDRDDFSPDTARSILNMRFEERDRERMTELAQKYNAGELGYAEEEELRAYRTLGLVIDILRAKANRVLESADEPGDG
jgi:hypothetical protein